MEKPQNFPGAAHPDPRRSSLGGAPRHLARTHCPNINWAKIMARQKILAALFFRIHAIQTFPQPTEYLGMLISRRTKLNVQRGQAQCPDGLNAAPRGAIINARGAKLNIQKEQTMPRGAKLNPQRAERPNPMPRRAKLNAHSQRG